MIPLIWRLELPDEGDVGRNLLGRRGGVPGVLSGRIVLLMRKAVSSASSAASGVPRSKAAKKAYSAGEGSLIIGEYACKC